MSTGSTKRKRADRTSALRLPPGTIDRMLELLRNREVLSRLGACLLAVCALLLVTRAWQPTFQYRSGDVPPRSVVARVDFSIEDTAETKRLQDEAMKNVAFIYEHESQPLMEKLEELKGKVFQILAADSFDMLDPQVKDEFFNRKDADDPAMIDVYREDLFQNFRLAMEDDADLKKLEAALQRALADQLTNGLLTELEHTQEEATLLQIRVRPKGSQALPRLIETDKVRIAKVVPQLEEKLQRELAANEIVEPIYHWLESRLPTTLEIQREATQQDREAAANSVPKQTKDFTANESILAPGGVPLNSSVGEEQQQKESEDAYQRVHEEYKARVAQMSGPAKMAYGGANLGMYFALCILCGCYIHLRQPELLKNWRRYVTLLVLVVATLTLAVVM